MALSTFSATFTATGILTLLLLLLVGRGNATSRYSKISLPQSDVDLIEFALNLEYLEAEFFLWAAYNQSLNDIDPSLTQGGPPPIVDRPVNVTDYLRAIIAQLALQEVGHIRAIRQVVRGFPRPLLNISVAAFASVMNEAMGRTLDPPFDPYDNGINFLLASYVIPYVGLNGYVGANPKLKSGSARKLVAGLLGVEAGQDALIRTLLYIRRDRIVVPYGINVTEFTNRISELRNRLGRGGSKDEGLFVDESAGAEGRIKENILAGNSLSLSFERTPEEILRIVYGGSERTPGGFYPKGAGGRIAKSHL